MSGIEEEHGEDPILWIARIAITIVCVGALIFFIGLPASPKIDVTALEMELIMNRVHYSTTCTAREDIRAYAGEIDLNKFTSEQLQQCIQGPVFLSATLENEGRTISNNQEQYNTLLPFCKYKEQYACATKKINVVTTNTQRPSDHLTINIILPIRGSGDHVG